MKLYQKIAVLSLTILGLSSTAHAVSDAELMKQGIWRDPKTGLMWDRCSFGQSWNGTTCTGEAIELSWQEAQYYYIMLADINQKAKGGYSNWRLPTIEELSSIRYCSKGWKKSTETKKIGGFAMRTVPDNKGGTTQVPAFCADGSSQPTINTTIFPNTKGEFYWSSSSDINYSNHIAWGVSFNYGIAGYSDKPNSFYVRVVRSN